VTTSVEEGKGRNRPVTIIVADDDATIVALAAALLRDQGVVFTSGGVKPESNAAFLLKPFTLGELVHTVVGTCDNTPRVSRI
jgi:hypothetical protein